MDLATIGAAAVSIGVATGFSNQLFSWGREVWGERTATERDARYLAIRLAVMLERFALDCAGALSEQDMYTSSKGSAGVAHYKLPELATYPDEADWKSLRPDLLARVLTLRTELQLSETAIAHWAEVGDECVPTECNEQCGRCGYLAWALASELRQNYNLGTFDPGKMSWDIVSLLKARHDEVLREKAIN